MQLERLVHNVRATLTIRLIAIFGICIFASGAQQSQDFLFRVSTQLVQVDVLVQEENGDPVPGLTKDDFILLDNGKPRKIDVFSVRSLQKPQPKSAASRGRTKAKGLRRADAVPDYATIVLFDQLNTAWENQAWAREQILSYLQNAESAEQIAIYSLFNKLKIIQEFTTDRETLAKALARTKPEFSMDLKSADSDSMTQLAPNSTTGGVDAGSAKAKASADAMEQNATAFMRENAVKRRVEITATALEILSKHLKGMPGRKKLIWISGSFPLLTKETHQIPDGPALLEYRDLSDLVEGPVRWLNDANVGVYPIDARNLDPAVPLSDPTIDTMVSLARQTGGRAIYSTNDLPWAIKKDMEDTDLAYVLGFYLSKEELDGSFHKLLVKVSRNDAQLRHRMGYTASKIIPATPETLQTTLKSRDLPPIQPPINAQEKLVVDMSIDELLRYYRSECSNLVFDTNQGELPSILKTAGAGVEAFFRDLSNTSSKEQVLLQNLSLVQRQSDRRLPGSISTEQPASSSEEFYYLILPAPPEAGIPWKEERLDKKGRPVDLKRLSNFAITSGFAFHCIYLHPQHQAGSRFRYLGRENRSGLRVIAFAQKPESPDYLTAYVAYANESILVQYLVQGFIWLHPDNYQIVRMETRMIAPAGPLERQSTKVDYREIHFEGVSQSFWLPGEVVVEMKVQGVVYHNWHRYSDYHLFDVQSDYKIVPPKAKDASPKPTR